MYTADQIDAMTTLQPSPDNTDDEGAGAPAPRPRSRAQPAAFAPLDAEVARGLRYLLNDGCLPVSPPISAPALRIIADGVVRALESMSQPAAARTKRRRPDVFDDLPGIITMAPGTRRFVILTMRLLAQQVDLGAGESEVYYADMADASLVYVFHHVDDTGPAFDVIRAMVRAPR